MKNTQDYIKNFEDIEIDENEFDLIDESFNDLEKRKIKKNMRERIGMKKKKKRAIRLAVIPAIIMIVIGITAIPAVAENISFISTLYEKLGIGEKYLDYKEYIGKAIEHNGTTVTIVDIVGSQYKVGITAKIESTTITDEEELMRISIGCDFSGNGSYDCSWRTFKGNNGENLVYAESTNVNGNAEKGELNIMVGFPDLTEEKLVWPVDFSKSFKESEEIRIDKTVEELDLNLSAMKKDIFGATLLGTSYGKNTLYDRIVLKVDGYMYQLTCHGSSGGKYEYQFYKDAYEKVKKAKEFSIIPISINMYEDEMFEYLNENEEYYEKNYERVLGDANTKYAKEYKFNDGGKANIEKIERKDNNLKVYYKASTEKHAMLLGSGMGLINSTQDENGQINEDEYKEYYGYFYKNNDGNYILEFDDVDSNKTLELCSHPFDHLTEKLEIGKEVVIEK